MMLALLSSPLKIVTADFGATLVIILSSTAVIPIIARSIGEFLKKIRPGSEKITITRANGEAVVVNLKGTSREERANTNRSLDELFKKELPSEGAP